MTRNSREAETMHTIGRIVRATRKQLAISQVDFAKDLGLMQSALSRIETGSQNLTAPQWLEICQLTGISLESIRYGYIEHQQPLDLQHGAKVGSFRLPTRYAHNRGSKVRATLPLLRYFKEQLGEKKLDAYFEKVKVDPDYFMNLENQINVGFSIDMCRTLIEKGKLKPKAVGAMTKVVRNRELHGRLHHEYDTRETSQELILSLLRNIRQYECNTVYAIDDSSRKGLLVSAIPEPHFAEVVPKGDSEMGEFLCQYKRSYLSDFSTYNGRPKKPATELECYYKGHTKCLYQVDLAS
jgi:transcriptional regulator with XRE-family HTH domain